MTTRRKLIPLAGIMLLSGMFLLGQESWGPNSPVILSITPWNLTVDATVTIAGSFFGSEQGDSTVCFNGLTADRATLWSDTLIQAQAPWGTTAGEVVVTVNGTASNPYTYTVADYAPPADVEDSPAIPPNGELDSNPISTRYVLLGQGPHQKTFAVVADPHVGCAGGAEDRDYAYPSGWNDESENPPNGYGADYLQELVNYVNENWGRGIERTWYAGNERITGRAEFVVVVGDLTQTAEISEPKRARRILDTLSLPYVPLIGNHDVIPHVFWKLEPFWIFASVTRSWADKVSSVKVGNVRAEAVVLYQSPNQNNDFNASSGTTGRSEVFFADDADLRANHIGNDTVRSVKCVRTSSNSQHCEYKLFLAANYGGCRTNWLTADIADLKTANLYCELCQRNHTFYGGGINPEGVSSIQVRYGDPGNAPSLYPDEKYGGTTWEYIVCNDKNLTGNRIGNDTLDSVMAPNRTVSPWLELYDNANFGTTGQGYFKVTANEYRLGHASPDYYRGTENVVGDRYFDMIFAPVYTALSAAYPNWKKHPGRCYVSDTARYIDLDPGYVWLQNFAFDVGDYNFMCLDFNLRKRWDYSGSNRKIAGGTGDCRTFSGIENGTLPWAVDHLNQYPNKRDENVLVFAHHPPISLYYWPVPERVFNDLGVLRDAFVPYRNYVNTWFAGHVHRSYQEEIYHEYQGQRYHLFTSVETNSSLRPTPHNPPGGDLHCLTIVTLRSHTPFPTLEPVEGVGNNEMVASFNLDERKNDESLPIGIWGVRDTQVYDFSGFGYAGVLKSTGAAEYVTGFSGSSINFNGDDWVEISTRNNTAAAPIKPAAQITIEAWLRPTGTAGYWQHPLGLGHDYTLFLDMNSTNLCYKFNNIGGQTRQQPIGEIPLNRWSHVAITYDGRYIQGYINGQRVRSDPATGNIGYTSNNHTLCIGASSPAANCWNGLVDNVRIYNCALGTSEIRSHASLVGHYTFDEQEVGRTGYQKWSVWDKSANANNGTARSETNGSFEWVAGVYGSSIYFNRDDWMEVPDASSLDLTEDFTIEARVYLEDYLRDQKIVCKTFDGGNGGFSLGVGYGGLYPEVWIDGNHYAFTAGALQPGRWIRITLVWNGTELLGYIDGHLVGRDSTPEPGPAPVTPGEIMTVGCDSWSRQLKASGRIDEVRIYNRALSEQEVAEVDGDGRQESP